MQNLKFFTLLRSLRDEEVPAFQKHLNLLHGGEEIALRVFEYFRKFYPDFHEGKKLEMAYAYRKIFKIDLPEKEEAQKKAVKKLLNALSDLHLWLKEFLLLEKVRRDDLESQALWLKILQERDLSTEYVKQAARLYTDIQATTQKDSYAYLLEMTASYAYYQQIALDPADLSPLQHCLDTLETCAEILKLKMHCRIANLKKIHPVATLAAPNPLPLSALPVVLAPKNEPLLMLYRNVYQLIESENPVYYDRIERALASCADQLNPDELHGIFGYLHNYVSLQLRQGKTGDFLQKAHELNIFGIEHKIFSPTGGMTARQFANIISAACSVKDFDWANQFISHNSYLLPDKIRVDIELLTKATVCFEKKDFEQVLALTGSLEFKDIHLVIRTRSMILRSYLILEKHNEKALDYCEKFENQLIRNRKPKTGAVESALNFVRLVRMILLENTEREELIDRIKNTSNLILRSWLLEQMANYKYRYVTLKRNK